MLTIWGPIGITWALAGLWLVVLYFTDDSAALYWPGVTRVIVRWIAGVWIVWLALQLITGFRYD
jgi:hypothetical protein